MDAARIPTPMAPGVSSGNVPVWNDTTKRYEPSADVVTSGSLGDVPAAQTGESVFAGIEGVTIPITPVASTDYHVDVTPLAGSGSIGQIFVGAKTTNSFAVKNTGSDHKTPFSWRLTGVLLA
jgi:hypothetical protein